MPVNIITTTIADHLPQFLRAPNVFANLSCLKLLKDSVQILIKKILFLLTSLLIGKPF